MIIMNVYVVAQLAELQSLSLQGIPSVEHLEASHSAKHVLSTIVFASLSMTTMSALSRLKAHNNSGLCPVSIHLNCKLWNICDRSRGLVLECCNSMLLGLRMRVSNIKACCAYHGPIQGICMPAVQLVQTFPPGPGSIV